MKERINWQQIENEINSLGEGIGGVSNGGGGGTIGAPGVGPASGNGGSGGWSGLGNWSNTGTGATINPPPPNNPGANTNLIPDYQCKKAQLEVFEEAYHIDLEQEFPDIAYDCFFESNCSDAQANQECALRNLAELVEIGLCLDPQKLTKLPDDEGYYVHFNNMSLIFFHEHLPNQFISINYSDFCIQVPIFYGQNNSTNKIRKAFDLAVLNTEEALEDGDILPFSASIKQGFLIRFRDAMASLLGGGISTTTTGCRNDVAPIETKYGCY